MKAEEPVKVDEQPKPTVEAGAPIAEEETDETEEGRIAGESVEVEGPAKAIEPAEDIEPLWYQLKRAVWRSLPSYPLRMDQLVHIQHISQLDSKSRRTPGTVVRVQYESLDDLPSLLALERRPARGAAPFPAEWLLPRPWPPNSFSFPIRPCFRGRQEPSMVL